MKNLFLILLLLSFNYLSGQARIGHHYEQVKVEYKDFKYKTKNLKNGKSLTLFFNNHLVVHIFNEWKVEDACLVFPLDNESLTDLINYLDDNTKRISEGTWESISESVILKTSLEYDQDKNVFYFLIRKSDL